MSSFFKEVYRLLNNNSWYLLLPRSAVLLFFGWLILIRPALSLRLCAWWLPAAALTAVLFVYQKSSAPLRHLVWLTPAAAAGALIFPETLDPAGIWLAALLCFITALRAINQGKSPESLAAAGTAAAAALLLFLKGFTAFWFDLYPAISLAFFAAAAWESGNLKFLK